MEPAARSKDAQPLADKEREGFTLCAPAVRSPGWVGAYHFDFVSERTQKLPCCTEQLGFQKICAYDIRHELRIRIAEHEIGRCNHGCRRVNIDTQQL